MHRNHPTPDHQRLGRHPTRDRTAITSPAAGPAPLVRRRQLEKTVSWTGRERLRFLWYRLRLAVAEMNYATRRMLELQAPWTTDPRWTSADRPR
jgi:hypothetical protein